MFVESIQPCTRGNAHRGMTQMISTCIPGEAIPAGRRCVPVYFLSLVLALTAGPTGTLGETASEAAAVSTPPVSAGLSSDGFHSTDEQLRGLIETLLVENPQLVAARSGSRARFEQVPQARSLPDPQLTYRYFVRNPETRVGPQEQVLEISQGVPWAGKRALQALRVENLASGTTWEVEDLERRLGAELKRAYFEVAYLQESLSVNSEERELLRRFESIALKRYATGQGIQQSVVKVQTDISRLDDLETSLRERLNVMTRRISQLIGRAETPLELASVRLPQFEMSYDREELEQFATTNHPQVRALERRVEADQVWASRRALESRPNFRFGVGYTLVDDRDDRAGIQNPPEENGKDAVALMVGVNIPIYRKRIRAGVAEAHQSRHATEGLLEATRHRLRFEIQETLLRVVSSGERGQLYRDVIIPQAEESLASAEAAYTTDRLGFLDLLDAERTLFQARLAAHRLVSDLWIALADLESAVGTRFPSSETTP